MTTSRFLVTAIVGLAVAAASLSLAGVLDQTWLAVVGTLWVVLVGLAHVAWTHSER